MFYLLKGDYKPETLNPGGPVTVAGQVGSETRKGGVYPNGAKGFMGIMDKNMETTLGLRV